MSYPPQRGEPGYRDWQYDQDQVREMEREASWLEYERFHEVTDEHLRVEARARITALEDCLRDLVRDLPCEHPTYDRCCSSCEARRLLSLTVRV